MDEATLLWFVVVFCSTSGQNETTSAVLGRRIPSSHPTDNLNAPHLYTHPDAKSPTVRPFCHCLATHLLPLAHRLPTLHFEPVPRIISSFQHVSLSPQLFLSLTQHTPHNTTSHPATMSSTIQSITNAIPSLGRARLLISSADDVVICSAVRTPITKVGRVVVSISCTRLIPGLRPRRGGSRIHVRKTCSSLSSERRSSAAVLTPLSSGASRHMRSSGRADKSTEMSRSATSFLQEVGPPSLVWLSSPLVSPTREFQRSSHLAPK